MFNKYSNFDCNREICEVMYGSLCIWHCLRWRAIVDWSNYASLNGTVINGGMRLLGRKGSVKKANLRIFKNFDRTDGLQRF